MKQVGSSNDLFQAFQLFDQDRDGLISVGELRKLIEKVGGKMSEEEARELVRKVRRVIMV